MHARSAAPALCSRSGARQVVVVYGAALCVAIAAEPADFEMTAVPLGVVVVC